MDLYIGSWGALHALGILESMIAKSVVQVISQVSRNMNAVVDNARVQL